MSDLADQAKPAVTKLLESDPEQLFEELGIRATAVGKDPALAGSFDPTVTYDAALLGPMDDLRHFGKKFFERWSAQSYNLVCGGGLEDQNERKRLLDAFGLGRDSVAAFLAALLVVHLGLAPALAAVVAALVLRLFFRPGYEAMCAVWKEKLPPLSNLTGKE